MTSQSTSRDFTDRVISQYLYGQDSRPEDIANESLIRQEDEFSEVEIDAVDYIENGPGRFARASFFEVVQRFFGLSEEERTRLYASLLPAAQGGATEGIVISANGDIILNHVQFVAAFNDSIDPVNTISNINFAELIIDQSHFDDGQDDYASRVFIHSSTTFAINEGARYVLRANGGIEVRNFAIVPFSNDPLGLQDNFDFEGGGTASALNLFVEPVFDPFGIGRRVDLPFTGVENIEPETLTEEGFLADAATAPATLSGDIPTSGTTNQRIRFSDVNQGLAALRLTGLDEGAILGGIAAGLFGPAVGLTVAAVTALRASDGGAFLQDLYDRGVVSYTQDGRDVFFGTDGEDGINTAGPLSVTFPHLLFSPSTEEGAHIIAGDGDDFLAGNVFSSNILEGNGGADTLIGGASDDIFFVDSDDILIEGGFGTDIIDYSQSEVAIDLEFIRENTVITSIEKIVGSDFDDRFVLDTTVIISDEELDVDGGAGNDAIFGNDNDNRLVGGLGADVIVGGEGDEFINGDEDGPCAAANDPPSGNDDNLFGLEGDDTIIGGAGSDNIFGGDGNDIIYGDGVFDDGEIILANDRTTSNFLFGGEGDDEIHLGYNDIAVGGDGADSFYVITDIDDATNLDFTNIFILDFKAGEDRLFVDGVEFDGFRKSITGAPEFSQRDLPNKDLPNRVFLEETGSSSFGLDLLEVQSNSLSFLLIGLPFLDGPFRDVQVASVRDSEFGRITFVDADIDFVEVQENGMPEEGEADIRLNGFLNIYTKSLGDSIFQRQVIVSEDDPPEVISSSLFRPDTLVGQTLGLSGANGIGSNTMRFGDMPIISELPTIIATGFEADNREIDSFQNDLDAARTTQMLASQSFSAFASDTFATNSSSVASADEELLILPVIEGPIVIAPPEAPVSFLYDGLLRIDLPTVIEDIQFIAFEELLRSTDLSERNITIFGNTISLNTLGVIPDSSELFFSIGSAIAAEFGSDDVDEFIGQSNVNLFIGNDGDDNISISTFNIISSSLIVGGTGNDQYILSGEQGSFGNIVIAESLSTDEISGGNDSLTINANSTDIIILRGNDINDIKILVPEVDSQHQGIIEVINQLGDNPDDYIEEFHFADGVILSREELIALIPSTNNAPSLEIPLADISSAEDTAIDIAVPAGTFSDVDGDALTITASLVDGSELPAWLQFDGARFFGTPPQDFNGVLDLRVNASDGTLSTSSDFTLSIDAVNDAPIVLAPLADVSSDEDIAIDIAVPAGTFSDVDGDVLTLTASLADGSELPAWLQFDGSRFLGTPPQDFNGVLDLRVSASDGTLSTSSDFTLSIDAVNDAPILVSALSDVSSDEDVAIDITVPAGTFSDVDGDVLTLSATLVDGSELPAWLQFDGARFFGTPPQDFNGVLDLRVNASDGELETNSSFALTIDPVNDVPVVLAPLADVSSAEDTVIDIAVPTDTFSDVDGDVLTLSATLLDGSALPAWLQFDGSRFFGTPPQDFNGVLGLSVIANDGNLAVTSDFTLSIDPVNDAPILVSALSDVSSDEDVAIDITVPAGTFSDVDGDALTLTASLVDGSELPAWLQFDGARFFGTPPQDFNGALDLRVSASDGVLSADSDFTLSIDPVNDAPIVLTPLVDLSSAEDTAFDIALPDNIFADVDADILTLSARLSDGNALPKWVQFDGLRLFGMPPQDFNGVLDVEITASDGDLSVVDSFLLTIDPVNDAPISADDDTFLSEGSDDLTITQEDLLSNDLDVDGDTLEVVEVSNGENGSVSFDAEGNIIYTPNAGFSGEDSFEYTISDGELTSTGRAQVRIDNLFAGFRQGSEGRDFLFGNFFAQNRIFGRGGNDFILGGFRNDQLAGGTGDDRIFGRFGNDDLYGNEGDDLLFGGFGTDTAHFSGQSSDYELITSFGGFFVRTRDTEPGIDGDDGRDQLFSIERLAFDDQTISLAAPIILDLDGDGTELVSAGQSNALFDLDGDGIRDDTSWIGNGDAFLFIDRDGNGTVSGVNEISFIDDAEDARSDLDGLRSFDSNADSILSAEDDQFAEFGVWQDRNGDGIVDDGEILTLSDAGVASINLDAQTNEEDFDFGDVAIVNQGQFTRTDGSTSAFVDAAITFFEQGVRDLPDVSFGRETFARKSKKYRLYSENGELSIGDKKGRNQINLTGASSLSFRNRNIGLLSTLVIDLDGDGIELRDGAKSDALFDVDGNGARDDTGWVRGGDGFIVIDRNNNGRIDDGSELNFLAEAANANNGLQALSILDSNGDGIISSQDVRFRELRIWVDRNENGITDIGELSTLEELGIASLNLSGEAISDRVKVGKNLLLSTSTFTRTDGSTGQIGDAVLSFTPNETAQINSSNNVTALDRFNESDLSIAALELEVDDPRLSELRTGFNRSVGFDNNLGFDIPQGVNIFDYFEDLATDQNNPDGPNIPAQIIETISESSASNVNSATDIHSIARQVIDADFLTDGNLSDEGLNAVDSNSSDSAVHSIAIEAVTDNFDNDISTATTEDIIAQNEELLSIDNSTSASVYSTESEALSDDQETAADNNIESSVAEEGDETSENEVELMEGVTSGIGRVDPDVVRISLMTQDMNSFGVKNSAESDLKRNTEINPLDYFAA